MFISKFSTENWQGNQNEGSLQSAREWIEIAASIKALDGQYKTLVTLETDGEAHMAIGGGPHQYIVYVTFDNETFHYLVDPTHSTSEVRLMVGGQEGIYTAERCVDISTALEAARTFAEVGAMEEAFTWAQDVVFEPA